MPKSKYAKREKVMRAKLERVSKRLRKEAAEKRAAVEKRAKFRADLERRVKAASRKRARKLSRIKLVQGWCKRMVRRLQGS